MNGYKPTKRKATGIASSGFPSTISGAEGQSRTDTGSPLPVFEFDAGRFTLSLPVLDSPVS